MGRGAGAGDGSSTLSLLAVEDATETETVAKHTAMLSSRSALAAFVAVGVEVADGAATVLSTDGLGLTMTGCLGTNWSIRAWLRRRRGVGFYVASRGAGFTSTRTSLTSEYARLDADPDVLRVEE